MVTIVWTLIIIEIVHNNFIIQQTVNNSKEIQYVPYPFNIFRCMGEKMLSTLLHSSWERRCVRLIFFNRLEIT